MIHGATVAEGAGTAGPGRRRSRRPLPMAVGLIVVLGGLLWWLRGASGIPDVGDPFDVAAVLRPIDLPDEDNAYTSYAEALAKRTKRPRSMAGLDFSMLGWSKAGPEVRAHLEQNRAALEAWRRGSERPDALYHEAGELRIDTLLTLVQEMRPLAELAALEGSRLEDQGDMAGAWGWYRAMLRHSRLMGRHGVLIMRLNGGALHRMAARPIVRWATDPRVDAPLLRRALAEVIEADALTPPLSDALKLEYLMYLRDLRELRSLPREIPLPGGQNGLLDAMATSRGLKLPIQRFWLRASNDVERSRRAARLLFANWLAQVDRPEARRAPIAVRSPVLVYADDPTAPPAARALPPEELAQIVGRNTLSSRILDGGPFGGSSREPLWEGVGPLSLERRRRSALIVRMAAELHRRETGRIPTKAGELVGPYLGSLPEGIDPDDPIPQEVVESPQP